MKMLEESTRVGKKNVVVIPSKIRKEVAIREGDLIKIRAEDGKIVIEKLPSEPFRVLARVIGEPYKEKKDEGRAEAWLKRRSK
jgi:AbrB family looped-hinge helix DNA binding protein